MFSQCLYLHHLLLPHVGITDPKSSDAKQAMTKLEALFVDLNLRYSSVKKPHSELWRDCDLLMSTILVRSTLNCYGANLELFLTKRLLPNTYVLDKRDTALHCILRVLRGPRFAEQPSKVRINVPRTPYVGKDVTPRFDCGRRRVAHKYSCVMPEFEEYAEALFRPDSLVWIQTALFTPKVKGKVKGMCSVANMCGEIMLTISSNSLSPSFIRGVLDYQTHKSLDFFAVGVRTVRIILDPETGFSINAATTRCNKLLDAMDGISFELGGLLARSIPEVFQALVKKVGTEACLKNMPPGFAVALRGSTSILTDACGEDVDVYRARSLPEDVNDYLQIVSLSLGRCLRFNPPTPKHQSWCALVLLPC